MSYKVCLCKHVRGCIKLQNKLIFAMPVWNHDKLQCMFVKCLCGDSIDYQACVWQVAPEVREFSLV